MAIGRIKKRIATIITDSLDGIKFFEGIAGPILMEVEFGGKNLETYREGGVRALAKTNSPGRPSKILPKLRRENTIKLWENITKKIHKEITLSRSFGTEIRINTYRQAQGQNKQNGVYFGSAISGIANSDTMKLLIYTDDGSIGEKWLESIVTQYVNSLWDEFVEEMKKHGVTPLEGNVTAKATQGTAVRQPTSRQKRFKSGIKKAHDEGSTRTMLGLQQWKGDDTDIGQFEQLDLFDQAQNISTHVGITYNDLYQMLVDNIDVDWEQKAMKKSGVVGKFKIENFIKVA